MEMNAGIGKIWKGYQSNQTIYNPLTPRRTQVSPLTEILIQFLRRDHQKISNERRAYESVDEKSLS